MLHGRLFGVFLLRLLREAILEYVHSPDRPISQSLLDDLLRLEEEDQKIFHASPSAFDIKYPHIQPDSPLHQNFTRLLHKQSLCHSSLLPSYARSHNITGDFAVEKSTSHRAAHPFPLVYNPEERHPTCDGQPLSFDYKDYFYVGHGRAHRIVLPNEEEVRFHGTRAANATEANVMICFRKGDWGNNPRDYVGIKELELYSQENTTLSLTINGQEVVNYRYFDTQCGFLENEETGMTWDYDAAARLDMRFNMLQEGKSLYITSIIIFL